MQDIIKKLSSLLIDISKNNSETDAQNLIEELLKGIINSEIDECEKIVKLQETNWGDVAVRAKVITKDVINNLNKNKVI